MLALLRFVAGTGVATKGSENRIGLFDAPYDDWYPPPKGEEGSIVLPISNDVGSTADSGGSILKQSLCPTPRVSKPSPKSKDGVGGALFSSVSDREGAIV